MKKTGKIILTLMLSGILMVGCAGCSGQSSDGTSKSDDTTAVAQDASEQKSDAESTQDSGTSEGSGDAGESLTESSVQESYTEISETVMVYGMWQLVFDESAMTPEEKEVYSGEYDDMKVTMIVTADGKATVSSTEGEETLTGEATWEIIDNELVLTGEGGTSYFHFKGSKLMARNSPDYMYYARIE